MRTWIIQSDQPVEAKIKARAIQTASGGGAVALHETWDRKIIEWTIQSTLEIREQMEHHQDMILYHKGGKVFWFDGGENGDIRNPMFLGYGDGVRTDFFIPYRFVYAPSLVMRVNYAVDSGWTLTESTGLVRFSTPPPVDSHVDAFKFKCRFKGYFYLQSEEDLYRLSDNLKSFASQDITIREFPY